MFIDAVHPEDRESVHRAYANSVATRRPYDIVHRLQMPDGRIKQVRERCETTFDQAGKAILSVGAIQDVTERVLAEESLRLAELRNRTIIRGSKDGFWRLTVQGKLLEVNGAYCRISG